MSTTQASSVPELGTPEREAMEKLAIETADQLLENHEDIGNALRHLTLLTESAYDKETASQMRYHVEQVWITRIVQGRK